MQDPTLPDGTCPQCIRDYAGCTFHRTEDRARDARRSENIRRVLDAWHQRELAAICLRHELESDEFGTRWEKAERILAHSPR